MALSTMTVQNQRMVTQLARTGRKTRSPKHTGYLKTIPFGIYPFMIAPVLAGDTMSSMLFQSRVVTDPIANRHLGWWKEYYWFYVKLRDLGDRDTLEQVLLNPSQSITSIDSETALPAHNFYAATGEGYINWVGACLKRVTEEYFRDEGQTWDELTVETGIPRAQVEPPGLWRSARRESEVTFNEVSVSTAGDNAFTMGELQDAYQQYELLRMGGFTAMTFEDYLAAQGVNVPQATEHHVPELIRYARSWQYPISAIDPTDGSAASAVTWSVQERADKDRFFREPGFIFGVTVTRPKMYLRQAFYAAQLFDNAYAWLPQVLDDDPTTSLRLLGDNKLNLNWVDSGGMWVDLKDVLLYGDQFVNFNMADDATVNQFLAITSAGTAQDTLKYPNSTQINQLFATTDGSARIVEDFVCTLNIKSRVAVATDTSRNIMTSQSGT